MMQRLGKEEAKGLIMRVKYFGITGFHGSLDDVKKADFSLEVLQQKIAEIERRAKHYPPTQSVLSELIQLKVELNVRGEK